MKSGRLRATTQPSLSDEEAKELLIAIDKGETYRGQIVGERFRASKKAYYHGEMSWKRHPAWAPPAEPYRLAVDELLLELMARERSPRIAEHRSATPDDFTVYGPFHIMRVYLDNAVFQAGDDDDYDPLDQLRALKLVDNIDQARRILSEIVGDPGYPVDGSKYRFDRTATLLKSLELLMRLKHRLHGRLETGEFSEEDADRSTVPPHYLNFWRRDFERACESLQLLKECIVEHLLPEPPSHPSPGRPRMLWKNEFVEEMAVAWRQLTLEEPSRSEDSLFGKFVYAAWNSLDDQMPEVSFARAIRERTGQKGR